MNKEFQYNISLIIEENFVSEVFKEEIQETKEKIEKLSNIKELKTYTLSGTDNLKLFNENYEIVDFLDKKSLGNEISIILVVSENNSLLWNNNQAYKFLNELKNVSLVALLNYDRLNPLREQSILMETELEMSILQNAKTNLDIKIVILGVEKIIIPMVYFYLQHK